MKVRVFTGRFGESYVDYDFDKYNAETGFEFAGADEYAVFNDMKAEFKHKRYKRVSDEEIIHLLYFGSPRLISGSCSKEWILEYYEAICPITTDGMDEFRKETHNYGESKMVKASSLKVGDKIYYDYNVLTVKNNNDNKIEFDVQGISIDNLDTLVEKL